MKSNRKTSLRALAAVTTLTATALLPTGCLDRPVGEVTPQTTNILVDQLVQSGVDKIDLLFVIDNSLSMADKQAILAEALPDLVDRFVSPICVDENGVPTGEHPDSADADCTSGAREFKPIQDIHIGVITTSLGGYGSASNCLPDSGEEADMARLVGSLPRAGDAPDFLAWTSSSDRGTFVSQFTAQVSAAGEHGCGWEAPLESWYRFLVDPIPYQVIERQDCPGDTSGKLLCAGPKLDASGNMVLDETILAQRKQFLRPDSLVAIIMLSDENDCSFQASGRSWTLAQTSLPGGAINVALRATTVCQENPNDPCCHSCGVLRKDCPTEKSAEDPSKEVGVGCVGGPASYYSLSMEGMPSDDEANLRCFQQKRRFGVDYLYPVQRYANALSQFELCPFADDLSADSSVCSDPSYLRPNPLFDDLTYDPNNPDAVRAVPRDESLIFLAGIVGVPWQDLAQTVSGQLDVNAELRYRTNTAEKDTNPADTQIQWDWIVGDAIDEANNLPPGGIPNPVDPMMVESIDPRDQLGRANPVTGEAPAAPASNQRANSINGHEWSNLERRDLQYACTFPIQKETDCPTLEEVNAMKAADPGVKIPNCDCTAYPNEAAHNPLCQSDANEYGYRQHYAKAYPSLRQLQVLRLVQDKAIVASICPKSTDPTEPDYGYRPAVKVIVDTLKKQLTDKCLPRPLAVDPTGGAKCLLIEAKPLASDTRSCGEVAARKDVGSDIAAVVRARLLATDKCQDDATCNLYRLCEISQLPPGQDSDCLNNPNSASGDGWCYVDPGAGIGSPAVVEGCADTEQRKVRFAGKGTPEKGTVTFFACAGSSLRPGEGEGEGN